MFFGIDGVVVNKKNACGLTAAVSKVSSGAVEFMPIYSVKFVKDFLQDAQKSEHQFKIISTNVSEEESDLNPNIENENEKEDPAEAMEEVDLVPLTPLNELYLQKDENILLVLGSEGEGVSKTINKLASRRITIPPSFDIKNVGKYIWLRPLKTIN